MGVSADERIQTGGWFRFVPKTPATFVLEEGAAGGSLDDSGLYRAPKSPGVFHARVTSKTDPSLTARVSITVAPAHLRLVAGALGGNGHRDAAKERARFAGAAVVTTDHAGHAYVGDDRYVRRVDLATGQVDTVAVVQIDSAAPYPPLPRVTSLALDGAGSVYFTLDHSTALYTVREGKNVLLAGAESSFGTADGAFETARFSNLLYVASDGAHTLYVADSDNQTVRAVDLAARTVSTLAGSPKTTKVIDGFGTAAGFLQTEAITWDPTGLLWMVDGGGYALRKMDPTTTEVTTVGPDGFAPIAGSIAVDGAGHVYVADALGLVEVSTSPYGKKTIDGKIGNIAFDRGKLVTARGGSVGLYDLGTHTTTIVAGADAAFGYVDGAASDARFGNTVALAWAGSALFVADSDSSALRRVDPFTGQTSTVATGASARFLEDEHGAVFLGGFPWRELDPTTYALTPASDLEQDLLCIGPDGTHYITKREPDGTLRVFAVRGDASEAIASFAGIDAMVADDLGHLFVVSGGALHRVDLATKSEQQLASPAPDWADGALDTARTVNVMSATYDERGGLLFFDGNWPLGASALRKVDVVTGEITTLYGTHGVCADGLDGTSVCDARAIALSPAHEPYFFEQGALVSADTPL